MRKLLLSLALLSLVGCGDDGTTTDAGVMTDSGAMMDASVDAGTPTDAAADSAIELDGGPVRPTGRVVVGHLGGDSFQLDIFDSSTLAPVAGSPFTSPRAYNDIALNGPRGYIALVLPGTGEVLVVDDATFATVATLSIADVTPLTAAFDTVRDRLYVYAAAGASNRAIYAYDCSTADFASVTGSPFAVDVVGTQMAVDTATGHLVGISTSTSWIGEFAGESFNVLFGGPSANGATAMAIDVESRRLYAAEGFPSQLRVTDLDDGSELATVSLPGDFPSGVAPDGSGGAFVLDGTPEEATTTTTLHHVSATLALEDTCGAADGCTIDTTETGLAADPDNGRVFVSVARGINPGELATYDVSTPNNPSEIDPESRPAVGAIPAWVLFY